MYSRVSGSGLAALAARPPSYYQRITVSGGVAQGLGGHMATYHTVVVGTDGSQSSLRAVDRAGEIAAESNAKLIITTGYSPQKDDVRAADALGDEAYKVRGNAPVYAILKDAHDRAKAAGATNIEERPIEEAPVHALVDLAEEVNADLLVVGNVGMDARSAIVGRLFSVPGAVASRARIDVLIVHTTD